MTSKAEVVSSDEREALQLLTFMLDSEIFATDIAQVQEVLEYTKVTPVPRTPDFMLGVINLRGSVVPVVDMRQQFEMEPVEPTVDTCIIITEVMLDNEVTSLGLLADGVKEVIVLDREHISPPPRIGSSVDTHFILGMGKYDDDFVIILDLPRVFSKVELEHLLDVTPENIPDND